MPPGKHIAQASQSEQVVQARNAGKGEISNKRNISSLDTWPERSDDACAQSLTTSVLLKCGVHAASLADRAAGEYTEFASDTARHNRA